MDLSLCALWLESGHGAAIYNLNMVMDCFGRSVSICRIAGVQDC